MARSVRPACSRLSHATIAWLWLVFAAYPFIGALADDEEEELPTITVRGQRVANIEPAGSYATLATELRYDPQLDVQSRGMPEAQADITIRGGLFENSGFRLGAVALFDPQTGHYAIEGPVAPMMLSSPELLTDFDNGLRAFNATVATVHYGFRRVREGGSLALGIGSDRLRRADLQLGHVAEMPGERTFGALFSAAGSRGDGTLEFGDHDFKRVAGQLQLLSDRGQTNMILGYQDKFFGWPGAYTGFAHLPETDHTKQGLLLLDHRQAARHGWFEVGAAYRWLEDDYDFDRRTTESGTPGSFEHETRNFALGLTGETRAAGLDWTFSGQFVADDLVRSTDLTHGDFNSRNYLTLSLAPRHQWFFSSGRKLTARAGLRGDWSSRDEDVLMPLLGLVLEQPRGSGVAQLGLEFSRTSQLPGYTALNSAPNGLFGGNADLGRETADTLTLSAAWESANLDVRGALFGRRDDDLVDWTYRHGAPFARQANPVDLDVRGAELLLSLHGDRTDLLMAYTWLDKTADYGGQQVDASFYALNYARHRVTAALLFRPTSRIDIRLDSEYRRQQENPLRTGSARAIIAAFSATWRLPATADARVDLVIDNLTDSDFEEFPGTPAVGRQITLGLGLDW